MAAPIVSNFSAIVGSTGATSAHFGTDRAAGNLSIAYCQVGLTGSGTVTFACSTYTIANTINLGGNLGSVCWAWRVLTNSADDDPTFTWGGATLSWHGQTVEFTGQSATNFIGQNNSASGTSSTTLTAAPLNLLHNKSIVYAPLFVMSASQVIGVPSGYSNIDAYNDSFGSDQLCKQTPAGSTSTAISQTISSNNWASFAIEVRSSGLPAARQNNRSHLIG